MDEITLNGLDPSEIELDVDGSQELELDDQSLSELELDQEDDPQLLGMSNPIQGGLIELEFMGYPIRGMSAYEVAVRNGFTGNEAEWLISLIGPESPNAAIALAAQAGAIAARDLAKGYRDSASASAIAAALSADRAERYAQDTEGLSWVVQLNADSVDEKATAVAAMSQQVEAWNIGSMEYAFSAMTSKNEANTSRADALVYKEQAASSFTSADIARASATEQAILATQARTESGSSADASYFSETSAESYADEARMEAAAARTSAIRAKAYRDQSELAAAASVIYKDNASASATLAGEKAAASSTSATAANISAGNASTFANQASASASDADGAAFSAQTSSGTAVAAKNAAAGSASTAVTQASNAASSASDAAYYAGLALTAESNIGPVSAKAQLALDTAVSADGRASSSFVFSSLVNGLASGFGSYNDGFGSVFGIHANEFFVGIPGTILKPFSISGGKIVMTGDVAINGNLVISGSIVTGGIQADAVTKAASAYTAGSLELTSSADFDVQSVSLTTTGLTVAIKSNFYLTAWHPAAGGFDVRIKVWRGPSLIFDMTINAINGDQVSGWQTPEIEDTPPAGTHTYTTTVSLSTNTGFSIREVKSRFMSAREFKR